MKTLKSLFLIAVIVTLTGCSMFSLRSVEKDESILLPDQVLLDNLDEMSKELDTIEFRQ